MAGGKVKGITIEFRGDTTKLDKAIKTVDKESKGLSKDLTQINRALKFNPTNTELLAQKQDVLSKRVKTTTEKLNALRQAEQKMKGEGVKETDEEFQRLRREIIETESQEKHFKAELEKLNNIKLTALSAQLEKTGAKFKSAGKTMTTYVTLPLTAVGAASIKAGMDFDAAMSQVAATMGTTTDQIQELREFAIEMGSSTSFSAEQAAEALNYMALAGYDAETSMKMLPTVLNLAAAGGMDLARASDMVTDSQSALGLSTDETTEMVDKMAKTASMTNTSVEQLGEAYLTVGGTAKMMKGGTTELSQVLGILADNGVKGSEGGTALRNILLSLSAPTDKAAKMLNDLGVSVFDADGNMRSMQDIIADLNKAMGSLTDEERTKAISTIFNKRDLKSVNALLGTSAERWDEVADGIDNAEGAAAAMADTQLDNLAGDVTILKSALEGAGIAISDALAPALRKLIKIVTKVVDAFNNASPAVQKVITYVGVLAAAVGPALLAIGVGMTAAAKIMKVWTNIVTVCTKAVGAFGKALAFVAANPVVIIIAAIVAIIAIFVTLWRKNEAFRQFWIDLWNKLKAKVAEFKASFEAFKASIVERFNNIKASLATFAASFVAKKNQIVNTFKSIPSTLAGFFGRAWAAIKHKFAGWASFWSGLWNQLKSRFTNLGSNIGTAISTALKSGVNGMIGKIESIINTAIDRINSAIDWVNKYKPGKDFQHVGHVALPRLARGGIVDSATLALIGEGSSSEAVVPLDEMWKRMERMMGAGGGQPMVINVYGAEGQNVEELAAAVQRRIIATEKRRREAWA